MPTKRQRPLGPNPKDRPNWDSMNEGQKRYAMEQWKLARVRRGEYFTPPGEEAMNDEEYEILNNFDLSVLGSPPEEEQHQELPNSQEEKAAEDYINQLRNKETTDKGTMDVDEVSSSQGTSRGVKRPATDPPIDAKGSANTKHGTSLPGTGGNLGGMTEGGSATPTAIFRPIGRHTELFTHTYRKKWRFLTSANANVVLNDAKTTSHPERWALTTALAGIPWEYAFFYMTPAEYKRLEGFPSSKAKHCSVVVKSWNTRVAFQTGDTQTSNATLNQNKFIQIGKGLRSVPYMPSSDRQYKYSSTEPMLPESFQDRNSVNYRELLKNAMYGYDNDSDQFSKIAPSDATGAEIYLRDYLTIYTLKKNAKNIRPGFPQLKNLIEEYDASACINQPVAALEYNFEYAPLSANWPSVPISDITDTLNVDLSSGNKIEGLNIKRVSPGQSSAPETIFNTDRAYVQGLNGNDLFFSEDQNYYKVPLEQAGFFEELNSRGYSDCQQPSLHVGIRAVPKLTTLDVDIQANSFLDAQGYFEIEAELTVESVDDFTHIKSGCFAPNTKGQTQIVYEGRPASYTYDLPNVYGRMRGHIIPKPTPPPAKGLARK